MICTSLPWLLINATAVWRAAGGEAESKRAKRDASGEASPSELSSISWTVSPTELREALSGLGKAAVSFELSEMHDASEVGRPAAALYVSPWRAPDDGHLFCRGGPVLPA